MTTQNHSVQFFDTQFQQQAAAGDYQLNPFEQAALPYLRGKVLDYGCGLGNLSMAAAQRGCSVLALDASMTAIENLQARAQASGLPIRALPADLRTYAIADDFDTVLCIGLLMFFDCETGRKALAQLKDRTRPGGTAVVNVLIEGTTYRNMFSPEEYCLFSPGELGEHFSDWTILHSEVSQFDAPEGTVKAFSTLIARKPGNASDRQ